MFLGISIGYSPNAILIQGEDRSRTPASHAIPSQHHPPCVRPDRNAPAENGSGLTAFPLRLGPLTCTSASAPVPRVPSAPPLWSATTTMPHGGSCGVGTGRAGRVVPVVRPAAGLRHRDVTLRCPGQRRCHIAVRLWCGGSRGRGACGACGSADGLVPSRGRGGGLLPYRPAPSRPGARRGGARRGRGRPAVSGPRCDVAWDAAGAGGPRRGRSPGAGCAGAGDGSGAREGRGRWGRPGNRRTPGHAA
jgi:hypothetical protein